MKEIILNEKNNFFTLVNNLFQKIEDTLNLYENEIDIDYEVQDYVMTINFSNKSVIIINKQEVLKQIWLATKVNGYHFNYNKNEWICNRSNKNFWEIFEHAFFMQSNKKIFFYER
ncbi:iron donor protein CyaY [Buchnera aphidicola]|uniref:Iron-sulfur cluster assembly protein CyaY n=1 Tax=Buchnera aphidicola (Lipaphis pseudobrassicae) TaxID=1258543 RepID=A0A4D6Y857_9GAMM|nr:iron donor protein CyaY [Buchnera aphidicola]QCI22408.1 iron donor protein CyaY [Buchnera aphidicola (Lipaphis pseudobrassicae)]